MNIPLFKVHRPENVLSKLDDVLSSGYWAEGESVRLFEKYLQEFLRNPYVITTNSCTSALHLSLKISNVEYGDYVMVTPVTCIASVVSVTNLGAIPVWVDVDTEHGMLTGQTIRDTWNNLTQEQRYKTKALIYVCWGGDLGPIQEVDLVCKELGIKMIVDAAQAFNTRYNFGQTMLGDCTHGDMVAFSFQAIKSISTGDGGAIAFRNEDDCKRAFRLKWFGPDRGGFRTPTGEINWSYDIPEIGYKFHMNNIAGCIGVAHMEELNSTQFKRLNMYLYNDLLLQDNLKDIIKRSWTGPTSAWVSTFLVDNPLDLLAYLKDNGVHTSQMHVNNDIYSGFKEALKPCELIGVKEFMSKHLCFPCGSWVTEDAIKKISDLVHEYYRSKE
jgi:dTDP-4-amino-4,6-dideoxygalactose transaminase